jgi:hypothetical protein
MQKGACVAAGVGCKIKMRKWGCRGGGMDSLEEKEVKVLSWAKVPMPFRTIHPMNAQHYRLE